jgi:PAS domain S-box-containing protein
MGNKKNGKENSFPVTSEEIDELERLEKEYLKSEERYKAIVEMAPDAITVTDLQGNIIYASPQTLTLHGYESTGELIGKSALELFPPEEQEKAMNNLNKTFEEGIIKNVEYILLKKDGTRFASVLSAALLKDDSGKPEAFIAFTRDISERKRAEEERRQHTRELTAIHTLAQRVSSSLSVEQVAKEALEAVVGFISPDLAMLYLQEGDNLNLMGIGPEGSKYYPGKMPAHRVGECLCGLSAQEKKSIFSIDIKNDPRCIWKECKDAGLCSFSALPLLSGDKLIGVLALGSAGERDFKRQAAFLETLAHAIAIGLQNALLYEEVQHYAGRLEQRVEDRTAELENKTGELERANIKLKEADRLKSVFLASMSHELRTPLNSIIGFTGILLMGMSGELNREQEKQLKIVKNSANHLLSLINDVLDISKIEAGKLQLSNETFDLDAVVDDVAETFSSQVNEKGLELHTAVPEGITLYSDMRRVKQILMNLVSNAVKFTHQGRIDITAGTLPGDRLEINVADTGIGIEKQAVNKLFLPFQQVDMTPTRQYEGTGLGLYLCKHLLTLLQGDIRVTSEYGKGSTFTVVLPLRYMENNVRSG